MLFLWIVALSSVAAVPVWQPPQVYTDLSLGDPPQQFRLRVDPDYEDILLIGERCKGIACAASDKEKNVYRVSESNSANDTGYVLIRKYGRSKVTGEYISDVVNTEILGEDATVEFGLLKTANYDFHKVKADGVFGMTLRNVIRGNGQFRSPIRSILSSSAKKHFTLYFNQTEDRNALTGQLIFGERSELTTADICDPPKFIPTSFEFEFPVDKIRHGDVVSHRSVVAKIDFTQQKILLPTPEALLIRRNLGMGPFTEIVACASVKKIPLELKIGGQYYELGWEDIFEKIDPTNCRILLGDSGDYLNEGNPMVLGEPFLRLHCITFDVGTGAIGIALSK